MFITYAYVTLQIKANSVVQEIYFSEYLRNNGSTMGCKNVSICFGSRRNIASRSVISFSLTIETAIVTAAGALRFAVRVCKICKIPFSTVNSTS